VECINPGTPEENYPTYYIDPSTCIDCGACVPECPFHAIYAEEDVPSAYQAGGGEIFNHVGLTSRYEHINHHKEKMILNTTRVLAAGEIVNLREGVRANYDFYK
jgi:ferredoxin